MPDWRVYYDDGATFVGAPEDAPTHGVISIVMPDPDVGRLVLTKFDYYCWWPDRDQPWDGHDIVGLIDYLGLPGLKRVLFGRSVPNEVYNRVYEAAAGDEDFPLKSASHPRELPGF